MAADRHFPRASPEAYRAAESLFASRLAASIHDMKNSLGVVLNSLDDLMEDEAVASHRVAGLQQETRRVRNQLVQLLALYRMENCALAPNIRGQSVEEFLEDCLLRDKPMLDVRALKGEIDCPREFYSAFDTDLIGGVVANAIHNAVRFAESCVSLAAEQTDGWLRLSVNDDGKGFPSEMIGAAEVGPASIDFGTGSTGLGLCFSATAAALHAVAGRSGFIRLENGGALGGGLFLIHLPQ